MEPVKVFYCYAREDEALRQDLGTHLAPLRRQGIIEDWCDRMISPGQPWEKEINQRLESAQLILLLVSAYFLNSDYCYQKEMKQALERHEAGKAQVIPIILRPVDWEGAPFSKLQCLPTDACPVEEWPNVHAAFRDIAQGIRRAAEAEIQRQTEKEEAQRRAGEAETRRKAEETESRRRAEETEARRRTTASEALQRVEQEDARRRAAEEDARRRADEAETQRRQAQQVKERRRRAVEAEAHGNPNEAKPSRPARIKVWTLLLLAFGGLALAMGWLVYKKGVEPQAGQITGSIPASPVLTDDVQKGRLEAPAAPPVATPASTPEQMPERKQPPAPGLASPPDGAGAVSDAISEGRPPPPAAPPDAEPTPAPEPGKEMTVPVPPTGVESVQNKPRRQPTPAPPVVNRPIKQEPAKQPSPINKPQPRPEFGEKKPKDVKQASESTNQPRRPGGSKPARCSNVLEKAQVGEPLSAADQAFLQKECR